MFSGKSLKHKMKNIKNSAIVIKVIPRTKDIFLYKLSDTFLNRKGLVRILISAAFFVAAYVCKGRSKEFVPLLLVLLGLLNPVVTPIWHYLSSDKLARTLPSNLISFCGSRISINDGKKRLEIEWEDLYKILMSKRLLLLFIAPRTAFIIPKDQMGKDKGRIETLVRENAVLCHTEYRNYM